MMSGSSSNGKGSNSRCAFTASQWQELEHQALIFKYILTNTPIPPHLLFSIKSSLHSSDLILHQPQHIGWKCLEMGFGRKIDPEPGRCRRTDGKKWRCSKEAAYPDSKYCDRHMHRGRSRSRKPVESTSSASPTKNHFTSSLPTAIPISRNTSNHSYTPYNNTNYLSSVTSYTNKTPVSNPLLYPNKDKDYRNSSYGLGMRSSSSVGDSWHLEPLKRGDSPLKHKAFSAIQSDYSYLQLNTKEKQDQDYYVMDDGLKMERENEPKKVMHHFFDEWPRNRDSWIETKEDHVQVSMSMPRSSHYDFFKINNEK